VVGAHLGLQEDFFKVVATDVEHLIEILQHFVQIFMRKAQPRDRQFIARLVRMRCRAVLGMRIAASRGVVEEQRRQQQQYRIEQHRRQHEGIAHVMHHRPTQHGGQATAPLGG
jgi:type II secretory pathway component PulM